MKTDNIVTTDDRGEIDEWCQTKFAEVEESSSPRQGYQKLMPSGAEEQSSLCQVPKFPGTRDKTQREKKMKWVSSNHLIILNLVRYTEEAGKKSELL